MASGTIYGTTNDQYTQVKVEWESRYSSDTNKSYVGVYMYFKRDKNAPGALIIKGSFNPTISYYAFGGTKTTEISNNGEWIRVSGGVHTNFPHDSNGNYSGTLKASAKCDVQKDDGQWDIDKFEYSLSGSITFDNLDEQASLKSVVFKNGYFSDDIEITYKPKADTYDILSCSKLTGGHVSWSFELGRTSTQEQISIQKVPKEALEKLYASMPDGGECRMQFTLYSYEDNQYRTLAPGDYLATAKFNSSIKIPADEMTMPTFELKCSPVSTLEGDLAKLYWPTRTKIKAEILNSNAKYGATVAGEALKILNGYSTHGSLTTKDPISGTAPITVTATVTDSRGISRTLEQVITPVAYGTPQIKPYGDNAAIVVARCDKDGNLTDEGTQFTIAAKREFTKINYEGEQITFCNLSYRVKTLGGDFTDDWITILEDKAPSDEKQIVIGSAGDYIIEQAYVVQLKAEDSIGNSIVLTFNLPSDKVYMHRSGRRNSIAFGGYVSQDNSFEVYQEATLHGGLVLKSESGDNYFRLLVDDNGNLTLTPVSAAQTFLLKRGNK